MCEMYLSLFIEVLYIFGTILYVPLSAKHVCHFNKCFLTEHAQKCSSSHCYTDIACITGRTIDIGKVYYGTNLWFWFRTIDCGEACHGDVEYNLTYTNEIMKLCNGQQNCSLKQWNTGSFWNLDIIYECQETLAVHQTTLDISTVTLTKSTSTSNNDASSVTKSKAENNDTSDQFPVATVALSITTGILVLSIILIGVVCIKRRKVNKEMIDNTHDQHNNLRATTNISYNETRQSCRITDSNESHIHVYDYATSHIATNSRYENEYNTIHETAKPLRGDQIYDHISNKSTVVNETIIKTKESEYDNLNQNKTTSNYDTTYDHVSKQSQTADNIYSSVNNE